MMEDMTSVTAPGGSDSPTPFSRAELAAAAQRRWAPAYAREHRIKRSASWLVAVLLATYVCLSLSDLYPHDPLYQRILDTCVAAYAPLVFILVASLEDLAGDSITRGWVFAWCFLIGDAVMSIAIFDSGKFASGILLVFAALGTGGVLSYGLYIPPDPSIDWDLVLYEKLLSVRTARGGKSYERIIENYRQAEEVAASWLRRFGYRDAKVTADKQDNGIDVESLGAIAQVKNWTTKRVGIKEVQRLEGSAKRGQACFFFAAHGYTRAAHLWAVNPDHPVRLFVLRSDGNIIACNYRARRAVWAAPFHVPVAFRRAVSFWIILPSSLFMLLDGIFFVYLAVFMLLRNSVGWGLVFGLMASCGIAVAVHLGGRPTMKVVKNIKNHKPIDIRKSFTIEATKQDGGLPSDDFVGYDYDPMFRLLDIIFDVGIYFRTLGRIVRARIH
jgi:hypothetical protein